MLLVHAFSKTLRKGVNKSSSSKAPGGEPESTKSLTRGRTMAAVTTDRPASEDWVRLTQVETRLGLGAWGWRRARRNWERLLYELWWAW